MQHTHLQLDICSAHASFWNVTVSNKEDKIVEWEMSTLILEVTNQKLPLLP